MENMAENKRQIFKERLEDVYNRTDGLKMRKANKLDIDYYFSSPDTLDQVKELGPERIYERFGLNYVF